MRQWARPRSTLLSLLSLLAAAAALSYLPEETECPHKVDPEIFSHKYWVVPGSAFRAWRTLPETLFEIRPSRLPGAGMGIFTTTFLPAHTWLGEYDGDFFGAQAAEDKDDFEYTWSVNTEDVTTHYVDAAPDHLSNWVRFINCPRHVVEENVAMHTCYGRVYYRTARDLAPDTELLVYYGDDYASDRLGINTAEYRLMVFAERNTSVRRKKRTVSQMQCLNRAGK